MYALARDPFDSTGSFGATLATSASFRRTATPRPNAVGDSTSNITPTSASAAPNIHATLSMLRRLKKYSPNANTRSFELAEDFLGLASNIRRELKFQGQIFADGNAVIVVRGDDLEAHFEFMPDGTVAANIDIGEVEWDADITGFDGRILPLEVAEKLKNNA